MRSDNISVLKREVDADRDKFTVSIDPYNLDKDYLDITLLAELDPTIEVEDKALSKFYHVKRNFTFSYLIKMNLTEIRRSLVKLLTQTYGDPRWGILLDEPLQKLDIKTLKDILAPIAEKGRSVYHRIFESKDFIPESHKNDKEGIARAAVMSALNRAEIIAIRRKGEYDISGKPKPVDPLFPWAFLYNDTSFEKTNPQALDLNRFWGFRYEIQELFPFTSLMKRLPGTPNMVAAICPLVDGNRHYEPAHPFIKYADRINMTPAPSIEELGNALKDFGSDCLYFYGHAFHPDTPQRDESCLILQDRNLTVDQLDIKFDAPHFNNEPILAFLNGCKTAPLNTWDNESVVGFFCDRSIQNLCCVLTVAEIPELFALEFGEFFWEEFLTEQFIGRALLNARRGMLSKYNNPLGLLYSLYGCVDTRLMPKTS